MTELEGRTSPGTGGSAWGGGHLALDAIVAYVDEELSPGAQRRALEHLSRCPECAAEVVAQTQARLALRASAAPCLSTSLLHNLRNIPLRTELPEPPAGLSVGPDGQLFELQRQPRDGRRRPLDRRVRLGAGAVVSGLAIGALVVAGNATAPSRGSAPALPGAGPLPRASLIAPQAHFQGAMLDSPAPSVPIPASAPARPSLKIKPALH